MNPSLIKMAKDGTDDMVLFECPGCGFPHSVYVNTSVHPCWTWNGSLDSPTFSPSIKVTYPWGDPPVDKVCHSFVTDGKIQFLGNCTHSLAGQTVPIPVWGE